MNTLNSTIFFRLHSDYQNKYIHGEIMNGYTEEDCKVLGIPHRKSKYPPLPNFTKYEEWKYFDGTLYLGIQSGKIWGDILFTGGPEPLINEKVKKIFEEEGVTGYRLYNVEFPRQKNPPKYWGVIPNGKELDTFFDKNEKGEMVRPLNIDLSTWDGKDFIVGLNSAISERLKNILEKHKIENIRFDLIEEGKDYRYING